MGYAMGHVEEHRRDWKAYAGPVVLSMGTLTGLNALWHLPLLARYGIGVVEHSLLVYLLGGSGLALLLLWRALGDGRLTRQDIGLAPEGWSPARRLVGVGLIVFFSYGGYSNLQYTPPSSASGSSEHSTSLESGQNQAVPIKPTWGDYCYWYAALAGASLAELLVFVGVGFCMVERCLKQRRLHRFAATTVAAILASVAFGLYHFSHAPSWWPLVFIPLMPVMLIDLVCFVLTRNFYLTLGLHNSFAALGMTQIQSMNPATAHGPAMLASVLPAFVIPFLVLHGIEWKEVRRHVAA